MVINKKAYDGDSPVGANSSSANLVMVLANALAEKNKHPQYLEQFFSITRANI
jgi:hypothetical protein